MTTPGDAANPRGDETSWFAGNMRHSAALGAYLKWIVVAIAGVAGGAAIMKFVSNQPPWWLALGLLGVLGVLGTYLRCATTIYRLSDVRIEFERGILSKRVDSLELWRVIDIRFEQSLLDRLWGNAKIILVGTDRSHPELSLYGLPNPRPTYERLRSAIQAARARGRPVEFVDGEIQ